MFKSMFFVFAVVTATGVHANQVLNGPCSQYDKNSILQSAFNDYSDRIIVALRNKLDIQITNASGSVAIQRVRVIPVRRGPGGNDSEWTAVEGQANLELLTSNGTALTVNFWSRFINSPFARSAWDSKPGFNIGLGEVATQAIDREGNVKGSSVSCKVWTAPNILSIQVVNKATGHVVLSGDDYSFFN